MKDCSCIGSGFFEFWDRLDEEEVSDGIDELQVHGPKDPKKNKGLKNKTIFTLKKSELFFIYCSYVMIGWQRLNLVIFHSLKIAV